MREGWLYREMETETDRHGFGSFEHTMLRCMPGIEAKFFPYQDLEQLVSHD